MRAGDTLGGIGARFGVGTAALARDNGLAASAKLAVGYVLRIDNRHIVPAALDPGTVVVNVPQRMLFYGVDGGGAKGIQLRLAGLTGRRPSESSWSW